TGSSPPWAPDSARKCSSSRVRRLHVRCPVELFADRALAGAPVGGAEQALGPRTGREGERAVALSHHRRKPRPLLRLSGTRVPVGVPGMEHPLALMAGGFDPGAGATHLGHRFSRTLLEHPDYRRPGTEACIEGAVSLDTPSE